MSRGGRGLAVGLALVAVVGALVAAVAWPPAGEEAPVAASPPPALSADEAAFYGELMPRLRAAAEQAHELANLGESRSRNLLAIRTAQRRMNDRLGAVDAVAADAASDRFAPALAAYRGGARAVRAAMEEAQAGFVRLDWDRVARATALMARGTAELDRAVALLEGAASVRATPDP